MFGMKKMKNCFVSLSMFAALTIVCLYTTTASAKCNSISCYESKITSMYITDWSDGVVFVETSDSADQLGNLDCIPKEGKYWRLSPTHPMFKEIYSALLAAHLSGKEVVLRKKNESECAIAYVITK